MDDEFKPQFDLSSYTKKICQRNYEIGRGIKKPSFVKKLKLANKLKSPNVTINTYLPTNSTCEEEVSVNTQNSGIKEPQKEKVF